jgi:hypothetical protein
MLMVVSRGSGVDLLRAMDATVVAGWRVATIEAGVHGARRAGWDAGGGDGCGTTTRGVPDDGTSRMDEMDGRVLEESERLLRLYARAASRAWLAPTSADAQSPHRLAVLPPLSSAEAAGLLRVADAVEERARNTIRQRVSLLRRRILAALAGGRTDVYDAVGALRCVYTCLFRLTTEVEN